jgi:hypothetical protein
MTSNVRRGMDERASRMFAGKHRFNQRRQAPLRLGLCMAFLLVVLSLWPALAVADPPVLTSVIVAPNENHPLSTWTLPAGVTSQFIQVSRSSEVNPDGYFTTLETFNTLGPDQTTFLDEFEFADGVHYVHVAGHDKKCTRESVCPPIQFSDVMTFQVPGVGSGPGGTLPPTGGGPGPDKVAPFETLSFAPVQAVGKLFVTARMSEVGALTARATVSVGGASKLYRFKTVSRSAAANVPTKLRLRLEKKKLKAVKRALKKGKRLKAKITVTAIDKAHNKRSQTATIRLKN